MLCAGRPQPSPLFEKPTRLRQRPTCIFAQSSRLRPASRRLVAMGSMSTPQERQAADLQAEQTNTEATTDEQRVPATAHQKQQTPSLTLLPRRHTKVCIVPCALSDRQTVTVRVLSSAGLLPQIVHLVRHGQGYHNVAGEAEEDLYKSYDFLDAHLTAKGWGQVGLSRGQSGADVAQGCASCGKCCGFQHPRRCASLVTCRCRRCAVRGIEEAHKCSEQH